MAILSLLVLCTSCAPDPCSLEAVERLSKPKQDSFKLALMVLLFSNEDGAPGFSGETLLSETDQEMLRKMGVSCLSYEEVMASYNQRDAKRIKIQRSRDSLELQELLALKKKPVGDVLKFDSIELVSAEFYRESGTDKPWVYVDFYNRTSDTIIKVDFHATLLDELGNELKTTTLIYGIGEPINPGEQTYRRWSPWGFKKLQDSSDDHLILKPMKITVRGGSVLATRFSPADEARVLKLREVFKD